MKKKFFDLLDKITDELYYKYGKDFIDTEEYNLLLDLSDVPYFEEYFNEYIRSAMNYKAYDYFIIKHFFELKELNETVS